MRSVSALFSSGSGFQTIPHRERSCCFGLERAGAVPIFQLPAFQTEEPKANPEHRPDVSSKEKVR